MGMSACFRPLHLRNAGFKARELKATGLGPGELKHIGFSATDLRNAGFSSSALRMTGQFLVSQPNSIPNFTPGKVKSAPRQLGNMTPRVRHFTDERVKISTGLRTNDNIITELTQKKPLDRTLN